MENPPKTGKYAMNYGVILGLISVAFGVMLFIQDAHASQSTAVQIIGLVLTLGVTIWAILSFKKANDGYLKLSDALKIGVGVSLISAIIYIIYLLVLVNFMDTELPVKIAEAQKLAAEEAGKYSNEQIQQQYDGTVNYFWVTYPFVLIASMVVGLIMGLIIGLITRKAKPVY